MIDLSFLTLRNLLLWIGAWSLIAVILMGFDKSQAMGHQDRISERTLHEAALMGGFPGIIFGAYAFHHKTSKRSFWPPVAAAVVVWLVLAGLFVQYGILRLSA
jgi:uncharacterized membrane protein YsdA (DUF1294 family)